MQVDELTPRDKLPTMPTEEILRTQDKHPIDPVSGAKVPEGANYSASDYFNMALAWFRSFTMEKMGLIKGISFTWLFYAVIIGLVGLCLYFIAAKIF